MFLEVFGNVKVRDKTAKYLDALGKSIEELVCDKTGRLTAAVDPSQLSYRDVDSVAEAARMLSYRVPFDSELRMPPPALAMPRTSAAAAIVAAGVGSPPRQWEQSLRPPATTATTALPHRSQNSRPPTNALRRPQWKRAGTTGSATTTGSASTSASTSSTGTSRSTCARSRVSSTLCSSGPGARRAWPSSSGTKHTRSRTARWPLTRW